MTTFFFSWFGLVLVSIAFIHWSPKNKNSRLKIRNSPKHQKNKGILKKSKWKFLFLIHDSMMMMMIIIIIT